MLRGQAFGTEGSRCDPQRERLAQHRQSASGRRSLVRHPSYNYLLMAKLLSLRSVVSACVSDCATMHLSELTLSGGQLSALGDEDGFRRQGGQDLDSAGSANHRFSVARAC